MPVYKVSNITTGAKPPLVEIKSKLKQEEGNTTGKHETFENNHPTSRQTPSPENSFKTLSGEVGEKPQAIENHSVTIKSSSAATVRTSKFRRRLFNNLNII